MLERTGILCLHSSRDLQAVIMSQSNHWVMLTPAINDLCLRSPNLLQQQPRKQCSLLTQIHILRARWEFQVIFVLYRQWKIPIKMMQILQYIITQVQTTTLIVYSHWKLKLSKIDTLQATVNSLSAKVALLLSYLGLEEQSTKCTEHAIRCSSRSACRTTMCQRQPLVNNLSPKLLQTLCCLNPPNQTLTLWTPSNFLPNSCRRRLNFSHTIRRQLIFRKNSPGARRFFESEKRRDPSRAFISLTK